MIAKFFTRRGAILVLAIGAAVFGTHASLIRVYDETQIDSSTAFRTAAQLREHADEIDILFLGDSHAKCGIDVQRIPGAFNLGILGGQYHHVYHELDWALNSVRVRPKVIVLPVDTHSLAWQAARAEEPAYWARRLSYPAIAWEFGHSAYLKRWFRGAWSCYWGSGEAMLRWVVNRPLRDRPVDVRMGFLPVEESWASKSAEERMNESASRVRFLHGDSAEFHPVEVEYFKKSAALGDRAGARIVLLRLPLSDEGAAAIEGTYARSLGEISELIGNVDYTAIDLSGAIPGQPELFADSDHLNVQGAAVVTPLVAEALGVEMI